MNLIIKGKIKKTLIFPAFAGCISVLLCIRIYCWFVLVIFGQNHIDLLGSVCGSSLFSPYQSQRPDIWKELYRPEYCWNYSHVASRSKMISIFHKSKVGAQRLSTNRTIKALLIVNCGTEKYN